MKPKKVVYCALVTDIFHFGHLQSLQFAQKQGDILICGVLTDKAAQFYKKKLISSIKERKAIIENLDFVDSVVSQDDPDPTENLKKLHKKYTRAQIVLVRGDDWRTVPGQEYLESIGGKVVMHPYYTKLSDFKIIKSFLERYKGKFKNADDFIDYFELEDFTYYNPRRIKQTVFSSKADTLNYLRPLLKKSKIEESFVFTVLDWKEDQSDIVDQIQHKFGAQPVVVRSSSISEDSEDSSMAGSFHSELDVNTKDKKHLIAAIRNVVRSYDEKKSDFMVNQILVQPHTQNVMMSGVLFTRDIEKNAPYYIINYDDSSGSTDSVTSGMENKNVKISNYTNPRNYPKKFRRLMESVHEIEKTLPGMDLDIEFAVNGKGKVILFQVRPLVVHSKSDKSNDKTVKKIISDFQKKYLDLSIRKKHLSGNYTILADMPDWNPAEIIGDNPHQLDYSLYDYIITDSAWHQARSSQYYYDVNPAQLVVLIGNKPYIDVRNSFNSFTPAAISQKLREKLVGFYLDKLSRNQDMQDKVEFEVAFTCYDLTFDKRAVELKENGFTPTEIKELKKTLVVQTNELVTEAKKSIRKDMNSVFMLSGSRKNVKKRSDSLSILGQAKNLLDDCKNYGTVQFSRLARLAFVGTIILKSLVSEGIISKKFYEDFMNSIHTVAKTMNQDFDTFMAGNLDRKKFMELYGHLRPGTYDITSMRYDKNTKLIEQNSTQKVKKKKEKSFGITRDTHSKITKALKKHGLNFDSHELFAFSKAAIETRELSKFEFTKILSDAIELIAEAGKKLGFSREEMAYLSCEDLFGSMNSNKKAVVSKWKDTIAQRKKERELNELVSLPSLISKSIDLEIVEHYTARPNFITQKSVEAEIIDITDSDRTDVEGKIVLIENGDPGYDWIFTKNPAGLITKYGGVASHMAIRTAEFSLPAAIGCGELFESIKNCKRITLDCGHKKVIF